MHNQDVCKIISRVGRQIEWGVVADNIRSTGIPIRRIVLSLSQDRRCWNGKVASRESGRGCDVVVEHIVGIVADLDTRTRTVRVAVAKDTKFCTICRSETVTD